MGDKFHTPSREVPRKAFEKPGTGRAAMGVVEEEEKKRKRKRKG